MGHFLEVEESEIIKKLTHMTVPSNEELKGHVLDSNSVYTRTRVIEGISTEEPNARDDNGYNRADR